LPVRKFWGMRREMRFSRPAPSGARSAVTQYPLPPGYPFPDVFTGISGRDAMLHAGVSRQYYDVGLSAVRCLETGLALAGRSPDSVRSILDLPCGHGRVARVLRARFPQAELTVCDIDRDGVDFCATHFRATGFYSQRDFRRVRCAGSFDLIWVGSLISHLPRPATERFLSCICPWLAPGGVLVCSSHGSAVAAWIRDGLTDGRHHMPAGPVRRALVDLIETGYGFFPHRHKGWRRLGDLRDLLAPELSYGTALIGRSFFETLALPAPWRVLGYLERAWADFQDIVVIGNEPVGLMP